MTGVRYGVRLLPAVGSLLSRVLHPLRRRAAIRRLMGRRAPNSVLFVCHGNICRSPYAAGAFRRLLANARGVRIIAAGFIGPDRPSPAEAVACAADRGVDLSRHRSKLLVSGDVQAVDLIVVMDAAQGPAVRRVYGRHWRDIVVLGDLDPLPIKTRAIRDPLDQPREVFEETYSRIDRCVHELVRLLGSDAEG